MNFHVTPALIVGSVAQSNLHGDLLGACCKGGLAPWQQKRVIRFIRDNVGSSIPVGQLASIAKLSISHFSRAFRASFGTSPKALVSRCRVEEAMRLLASTDCPLAEVAHICGFADQSHFTRTFQRQAETSPGRWRRAQRPFEASIQENSIA